MSTSLSCKDHDNLYLKARLIKLAFIDYNKCKIYKSTNLEVFIMIKKIHTKEAPEAIGPYSQAAVIGGMVYTSGQIAINPETGNIEAEDIKGQTRRVMENLAAVLKAADSSFDDCIKTTCFLADIADFAAFNEVYAEYITSNPARSCVAVKALPKSALVEVEVIAAVKEA